MLKGIDPLLPPDLLKVLAEPVPGDEVVIADANFAGTAEGCFSVRCEARERFAFYDRVRRAPAIVLTGELLPWGNFLFKNGVLGEALVP